MRLPFGPLEVLAAGGRPQHLPADCTWCLGVQPGRGSCVTVDELAARLGTSNRQVHRWRRHGIPDTAADRTALALGLHPMVVWGSDWP